MRIVYTSVSRFATARHSQVGCVWLVGHSWSTTCFCIRTSPRGWSAPSSWRGTASPPPFTAAHVDPNAAHAPGHVASQPRPRAPRLGLVSVSFRFGSHRLSSLEKKLPGFVGPRPPSGSFRVRTGTGPVRTGFATRLERGGCFDGNGWRRFSCGGGRGSTVAAQWRVEMDSNAWRLGSRR